MNGELLAIQQVGLRDLTIAMNGGHCLALVGSGPVSRDYGTWPSLLGTLHERMGQGVLPFPLDPIPSDQLLKDWAERLATADEAMFCRLMHERFSRQESIPQVYNAILRARFKAILTTNFDDQLITMANVCGLGRHFTPMAYPALKPELAGAIVHLHGRILTPADVKDIVFTTSQFARAYLPTGMLRSMLTSIFFSYHLCFIGYSFSETEIQEISAAAKAHFQLHFRDPAARRRVFALIKETDWESVTSADGTTYDVVSRMKAKFEAHGITPIPYSLVNDQYAGLRQLIEQLPVQYPLSAPAQPAWLPSNEQHLGGPNHG